MGRGRSLICAVGGLVTLGATIFVAFASPAAAEPKPTCAPNGAELVADISQHLFNGRDAGVDGHTWALDDLIMRVKMWRVGTDRYCAEIQNDGSFNTFAGPSPNLTGTVSAGVTGQLSTTFFLSFTGKFVPRAPVSGFLGDFDMGCNQDGQCVRRIPGPGFLYFANGFDTVTSAWYLGNYAAGSHGTWTEFWGHAGSLHESTGDITG